MAEIATSPVKRSEPDDERNMRVEDYLNDKLQTLSDLDSLDSLIASVQVQHEQLQRQVQSLCIFDKTEFSPRLIYCALSLIRQLLTLSTARGSRSSTRRCPATLHRASGIHCSTGAIIWH
jgi:hypothetical protein